MLMMTLVVAMVMPYSGECRSSNDEQQQDSSDFLHAQESSTI